MNLESSRLHDILVLGVLSIAGFAVSILSCIFARHSTSAKPLLGPRPGKLNVSTSCTGSTARGSTNKARNVNGHGLARSKVGSPRSAARRAPPPDCGTSVSITQSPGESHGQVMGQQRRSQSGTGSEEAMDLRNGPAVQKLLERFEDLSARLRQHVKLHGRKPSSNRMRSGRSSSEARERGLCRETPAATKRRFDLLCREVQANRARLQTLSGSNARRIERGSGYAEIPDYANVHSSVGEVGTLSASNPGLEGVIEEFGGILCSKGAGGSSREYPTREADLEALRQNRKFLADCNSTLDQIMAGWGFLSSQSSEQERRPSSTGNASKSQSTSSKAHRPCRSSCPRTRGVAISSGSAMRSSGARSKRRSSNEGGSSSRIESSSSAYAVTSGAVGRCRYGSEVSPITTTCPLAHVYPLPECVYFPGVPHTVAATTPPWPSASHRPNVDVPQRPDLYPGAFPDMPPCNAGEISTRLVTSAGGHRCFPPPLPLPRPDGNVLQEARAYAPAQHLAVLRALLNDGPEGAGGDDEAGIQDEFVSCSDDSDCENEDAGAAGQGSLVKLNEDHQRDLGGTHGDLPDLCA